MYSVHHCFPSTGEWGTNLVESESEAWQWYRTKSSARSGVGAVVTLYGPGGEVMAQTTVSVKQ